MLMALGEELYTIHLALAAAPAITIVVHKPLTSLEELCTHIQDIIETFAKQWLRIHLQSTDMTMSTGTCVIPHILE